MSRKDKQFAPVDAVTTGWPSPAADYVREPVNLDELLVRNPPATFLVRVVGDGMEDAGIWPDDILIVDRSLTPRVGRVVVAVIDGCLTVTRVQSNVEIEVWGVVTTCLHSVQSP